MSKAPRLAVSIGCPSGIGPEVSVVAALEEPDRVLLVGSAAVLRRAARGRGLDESRLVTVASPDGASGVKRGQVPIWEPAGSAITIREAPLGAPTKAGGAAQLAWIDAACDLVSSGAASALVTGPASKESIVRSGAPGSRKFLGHTEHLQRRLGADEVVMAFYAERLATALVTTHLPLARVPRAITKEAVARASYWLGRLVVALAPRTRKKARPRVAVAGLNPHAGEGGLLGHEEEERIAPGMGLGRRRLAASHVDVELVGPVPAETAYRLAARGQFDGVVAMYHDQATIPMKLVGFGEAVNVSLALPIVRTSVDHGTGYDRAGSFTADARGMAEALALGARLAEAGLAEAGLAGNRRTKLSGRTPAGRRTPAKKGSRAPRPR